MRRSNAQILAGRQGLAIPAGQGTRIRRRRRPFFAFNASPRTFDLALAGHRVPGVSFVAQEHDLWCWAACAEMALQRSANPVSQKSLASDFSGQNCFLNPLPAACDSACDLNHFATIYAGMNVTLNVNPIGLTDLQDEINANRLVQVGFSNSDFEGHVALVVAWASDATGIIFTCLDPARGERHDSLQQLLTGHPVGSWQYTWTGL